MKTEACIFYDDNCPACSAYTAGFVRLGLLSPEGRVRFSQLDNSVHTQIDQNRARHEIALVDHEDKKTFYGVSSLLWLMFRKHRFLFSLFTSFPLYHILLLLYRLISYNRRVISPVRDYFNQGICSPDFHKGWRLVFVLICGVVTTAVALPFFLHSPVPSLQKMSAFEFVALWFFALVLQAIYGAITSYKLNGFAHRMIEYAGQCGFISLIGSFILAPSLLIADKIAEPLMFNLTFGTSYLIMLILHIRRMKQLKFHFSVTITWILFRLWMLIFLFPDMIKLLQL